MCIRSHLLRCNASIWRCQHGSLNGKTPSGVYFSAGNLTPLILKDDGTVAGSAKNKNGKLGDGTEENRSSPVQVLGSSNIVAIPVGNDHALII